MIKQILMVCAVVISAVWSQDLSAQTDDGVLTVATVTRAPFSLPDDTDGHTGFSIDLLNAAADQLDIAVEYDRYNSFGAMLEAVQNGQADAAIANISITAAREQAMDFSQPIFDGGVQVMLRNDISGSASLLNVLFTRDIGLLVLAALISLLAGGMLMWVFERRHQPYFDHTPRNAIFPAFWWALNLVVNGGFEERMPRSRPGRVFGVLMVIGSLFFVSIFVAQITAVLTVNAIQDNVESLSDLEGRQVGTIQGSTTTAFLIERGIDYRNFATPDRMFEAFEEGVIEAVVFDGPILAYYVQNTSMVDAHLLERVYRPEKYGMAFPTGSVERDPIDQAILSLRENGTYSNLLAKWFGATYAAR